MRSLGLPSACHVALAAVLALAFTLGAAGPAQAGFGLTKLRAGSVTAPENYLYTACPAPRARRSMMSGLHATPCGSHLRRWRLFRRARGAVHVRPLSTG